MGHFRALKILSFWFPVALYSAIIFYVSSLPRLEAPVDLPHLDKGFHVLEYVPFGFLLARAWANTKKDLSPRILIGFVVLCSFLYGLSDEYHQSFVLGRFVEMGDLGADSLGGLLGAAAYLFLTKNTKSNKT